MCTNAAVDRLRTRRTVRITLRLRKDREKGVRVMKRYPKTLLALGGVILLIVTVAAVANAQNAKLKRRILGQEAIKTVFRAKAFLGGLNLTDQQKAQVKTLLANHREEIWAAAREYAKARLALGQALAHGASDQTLKAAFDKVSSAEWNAVTLRSKMVAEVEQVLTPDQQTALQQKLSKADARIQKLLNRVDKKTSE
jgi:Spy/CpxP family protein refolding chaperone